MNKIKVTLLHHTPLYISANGARTCWTSFDKSDTELRLICDSCGAISINTEDGITNFEMNIGDNNQHECNNCRSTKNHWESVIGPKDLALIDRVGNKFHHASILEHISMNFFIDGISRACLQELARHRIASLSVKSSRYTLKELKDEQLLIPRKTIEENDAFKYQGDGWWIHIDGTPYYSDRLNSEFVYDTKLVEHYCVIPQNLMSYQKKLHYTNKGRMLWTIQENLKEGQSNDIAKYDLGESYRTQLTWSINLRSLQNFLSLRTDKKALPEIQILAELIYVALPADIQSLVKHCVKE